MIWILLALIGALSTSLTTIFVKVGIKDVESNFATYYRTGVVILCCIIMCVITNSFKDISLLTWQNSLFLILSGLATGCSWLCYYKALKLGDVNKVAPIDKSSFILTSILFLIFFFNDTTHNGDIFTIVILSISMLLMLIGTLLMISKKAGEQQVSKIWLIFAILSAVFASLVSLFVKIGLQGIPSYLGTLFRTIIVFIFAGAIMLGKKEIPNQKEINKRSWIFLTLSGITTGIAWIAEHSAFNYEGANPIVINSIGKLSILLTMLFTRWILKEKFTKKSILGLALLTVGIVLIIIFSL